MTKSKINKTELAATYVQRYIELATVNKTQYSKKFIASVLFAENPTLYKDSEDARVYVRHATNSVGRITNKHKYLAEAWATMESPIAELDSKPFVLPKSLKNTLVLSDIHGRFYDQKACDIAINYGINKNCDSVVINGDFLDFYQLSKFDKNPGIKSVMEEREWGQDFLKILQDLFGNVTLKMGNHDKRMEDYVNKQLSASKDIADMLGTYQDFLFFDGCHVNFVEAHNIVQIGKLNLMHGHEYGGFGGGINVARNRFLKALDNIMSAHSHKSMSYVEKSINNVLYGSWTTGCLCNLNPAYAPKNKWDLGFGRVEKESDGDFEVDNRLIIGSKSRNI